MNAVHAVKAKPSVLHPTDPNLSRYDDYPEIHMNAMMASDIGIAAIESAVEFVVKPANVVPM